MNRKQIIIKVLFSVLLIITICLIKQNSYAKYFLSKNINALNVNLDFDAPELEFDVQEEGEKRIVTITSNEEIKPVDGWELKEDRKTLVKEFIGIVREPLIVEDLYSNCVDVKVMI